MRSQIRLVFIYVSFFITFLYGEQVNITDIYINKGQYSLTEIEEKHLFKPYGKDYINTGIIFDPLVLKLAVSIEDNTTQNVLVFGNAKLEQIALYNATFKLISKRGYANVKQYTTYPYILLPKNIANYNTTYYVVMNNLHAAINFPLYLKNKEAFFIEDYKEKLVIMFLIATLISFIAYGFMLYIYTKSHAYLFYSLYLSVFLLFQNWYLGFSSLGLSQKGYVLYAESTIFQIALLIILFGLFAMYFLQTVRFPIIHYLYKMFLTVAFVEAVVLYLIDFYDIVIMVITGFLYVIFNMFVGSYLFLVKRIADVKYFFYGYIFGFLAYIIIILDELGYTRVTYDIPYVVLLGTSIEALVFLLAFYDKFRIGTIQETQIKLLQQKYELQQTHLNDIHHRVKNNLSAIIAMVDGDSQTPQEKERYKSLKNRIYAIAETYNILIDTKDMNISFFEYVDRLILNIQMGFTYNDIQIYNKIDKTIKLPHYQTTYLGLIINEVITNSLKHAFPEKNGEIFVSFTASEDEFVLTIADTGCGFDKEIFVNTYGLRLIKVIVESNLSGVYKIDTINGTTYTIRFKIGDFDR